MNWNDIKRCNQIKLTRASLILLMEASNQYWDGRDFSGQAYYMCTSKVDTLIIPKFHIGLNINILWGWPCVFFGFFWFFSFFGFLFLGGGEGVSFGFILVSCWKSVRLGIHKDDYVNN